MTILHDSVVRIGGLYDSSEHFVRGDLESLGIHKYPLELDTSRPLAQNLPGIEWRFEHRKHCGRVVFKEVGTALDQIDDQQVLFDCLSDSLQGAYTPSTLSAKC